MWRPFNIHAHQIQQACQIATKHPTNIPTKTSHTMMTVKQAPPSIGYAAQYCPSLIEKQNAR